MNAGSLRRRCLAILLLRLPLLGSFSVAHLIESLRNGLCCTANVYPLSHATADDYDALNRLVKVTQPLLDGAERGGHHRLRL